MDFKYGLCFILIFGCFLNLVTIASSPSKTRERMQLPSGKSPERRREESPCASLLIALLPLELSEASDVGVEGTDVDLRMLTCSPCPGSFMEGVPSPAQDDSPRPRLLAPTCVRQPDTVPTPVSKPCLDSGSQVSRWTQGWEEPRKGNDLIFIVEGCNLCHLERLSRPSIGRGGWSKEGAAGPGTVGAVLLECGGGRLGR